MMNISNIKSLNIAWHSPISRLWIMSDRGHQLQHIHACYNQFKIFYFNIRCLPTLSFYDIKDAAVICVTLTDGLTSWDALMILWNTCVWVGWCWVRKNSGALVHLHHVSMTCSDAILCYFCIFWSNIFFNPSILTKNIKEQKYTSNVALLTTLLYHTTYQNWTNV